MLRRRNETIRIWNLSVVPDFLVIIFLAFLPICPSFQTGRVTGIGGLSAELLEINWVAVTLSVGELG